VYVVSGCKGRDLTLQGGVIHVTFMLQSSFFCLVIVFLLSWNKRKKQRKIQGWLFSPTRSLHCAKGQKLATLKQSALFDAPLRGLAWRRKK